MSKILQKAVSRARNRGNKVPVKRTITRGGKTFQQTFWVSPERAEAIKEEIEKKTGKFSKDAQGVLQQAGSLVERYRHAVNSLISPDGSQLRPENADRYNKTWQEIEDKFVQFAAQKLGREAAAMDMDTLESRMYVLSRDFGRNLGFTSSEMQNFGSNFQEKAAKAVKRRFKPWKQKAFGGAFTQSRKPNPFPDRLEVDEHALRDLELYIDNTSKIALVEVDPVHQRHIERWKRKEFSEKDLIADLKRPIEAGIDAYMREFNNVRSPLRAHSDEAYNVFPPDLRTQLARDMARHFTETLESGEHGDGGHRPTTQAVEKPKGKIKKAKMGKAKATSGLHEEQIEMAAYELDFGDDAVYDAYAAPEGYETTITHSDFYDDKLALKGEIKDDRGRVIGEIERNLYREWGGGVVAEHEYFKIKEEFQDQKIGTRMILNQFETYESMGVSKVELSTAWVGRYFWLKCGFRPNDSDEAEIREYVAAKIDKQPWPDEQKAAVHQMLDSDIVDFARMKGLPKIPYRHPRTGRNYDEDGKLYEAPINKAALLDYGAPGWSGELDVGGEDWDKTLEILNGYFEDE